MSTDVTYSWIPFYQELAAKLLPYRNYRTELLSLLKEAYSAAQIKFPRLEAFPEDVTDIDPFTIFGFFNKGITKENRLALIQEFKKAFSIDAPIPTDFVGVPVINNLKACFFGFKNIRKTNDIDHLWECFENAIAYADSYSDPLARQSRRESLVASFDLVRQQYGVKWNITMGLFWIRPYVFLNLDSRSRWFVGDCAALGSECAERFPHEKAMRPPTGSDYLNLCDYVKSILTANTQGPASFPELSTDAWVESEHVNAQRNEEDKKERRITAERSKNALGDESADSNEYGSDSSQDPVDAPEALGPDPYGREEFLDEVYLSEESYD